MFDEEHLKKVKALNKDEKYIPPGSYCYEFLDERPQKEGGRNREDWAMRTLSCPYREIREDKPKQMCGYCHYLEAGDWEEDGTLLVWDGVKECGVNYELEKDCDDDYQPTDLCFQKEIKWMKTMLTFIDDEEGIGLIEKKIQRVEEEKERFRKIRSEIK